MSEMVVRGGSVKGNTYRGFRLSLTVSLDNAETESEANETLGKLLGTKIEVIEE